MSGCCSPLAAAIVLVAGSVAAGQEEGRADHFGDPLPAGAIGRLGTLRLRHGARVSKVCFLPDAKTLASLGNGTVLLSDLHTGKERKYFQIGVGDSDYFSTAISPDRSQVAVWDGES